MNSLCNLPDVLAIAGINDTALGGYKNFVYYESIKRELKIRGIYMSVGGLFIVLKIVFFLFFFNPPSAVVLPLHEVGKKLLSFTEGIRGVGFIARVRGLGRS